MEDGFGARAANVAALEAKGLNPCFSGRWFRSLRNFAVEVITLSVLILVLVEDGFGAPAKKLLEKKLGLS